MFVYYLDACLTPYWKLLVLGLWLVTLLFIALQGRGLLRASAVRRSLDASGISGEAYERLKPDPGKYWRRLGIWGLLSIAVLLGYVQFFSTFKCTPDSLLYWVPQYGNQAQ
ncbi:hypothetical protein [Pelagibius sp.]|uniref:hypothetical protein n=1 Tax=Pelagibius sp. TaxID=1931238 RepID=UPI00261F3128|nr:hypothetical protein [Pelagibius sp.]